MSEEEKQEDTELVALKTTEPHPVDSLNELLNGPANPKSNQAALKLIDRRLRVVEDSLACEKSQEEYGSKPEC